LKESELSKISLDVYIFATGYCRENSLGGGVCVFTKQKLAYHSIDLSEYCSENYEKYIFLGSNKKFNLIILCVYRPPTGNLKQFCVLMENILYYLLKPLVNI
jgi:hypothetical protein